MISRPAPFSSAATAQAYDWQADEQWQPQAAADTASGNPQSVLFSEESLRLEEGRVIPFDSLTSRVERQAIRARAANLDRPAPLKTERVQVKRARQQTRSRQQRTLEFDGQQEIIAQPQSSIICDAIVAPATMRLHAAIVDGALMFLPCLVGLALFGYVADSFLVDRRLLPYLLMAFATVPVLYKSLWTIAGADTPGMRSAGLVLVDFDGNPPSLKRRYQRCFGSYLSLLAAGVGLLWSLVDEDRLTWHDHISSTFPTVS